ncbi:hypothetical protein [Haloarchaeobius sp. TZWSO28]|uniref:hypothetical protein n=1 Tax=unclassified Haloarchaeobius TaxID=2614452 RepID=UPI003EBDCEE3
MSLSAVLLYAVLDELPEPHTRIALSLLPLALLGTALRVLFTGGVSDRLGLALALLAGLFLLGTVLDGLRREKSLFERGYDTLS